MLRRSVIALVPCLVLAAEPSLKPDTPFKLATFETQGRARLGMVVADRILDLAEANTHVARKAKLKTVSLPADMRTLIEQYDQLSPRLYQIANFFQATPPAGLAFAFDPAKVSYKAPIKYPWNVLAAAANYKLHAEGMGAPGARPPQAGPGGGAGGPGAAGGFNAAAASQIVPDRDAPIFFAKSPRSCIIDPGEAYYIPPGRTRIDWEGEMAIVMGKETRLVDGTKAHDHVFGYSIMYDVSDRGGAPRRQVSMFGGPNWFEGKSIDRGAPFGPFIVPKEFVADPANLRITTKVNGEVMQEGSTKELIWDERHMITYLSQILTLYPGDVISTGTPAGTGSERQKFLKPGDVVSIEVEGLGTLTTPIKAWDQRPK